MAKTETLTDDFASADSGKWDYASVGADASVSGGQLHVDNGNALYAQTGYDLTGSYIFCETVNAGSQAALLYLDLVGFTGGLTFGYDGSTLTADDLFSSNLGSTTYNSTTHRWLRIREAGGTAYFEASADGSSWSTIFTASYSVGTDWLVGISGAGAVFDNFNIPPAGTPSNTGAFFAMF